MCGCRLNEQRGASGMQGGPAGVHTGRGGAALVALAHVEKEGPSWRDPSSVIELHDSLQVA